MQIIRRWSLQMFAHARLLVLVLLYLRISSHLNIFPKFISISKDSIPSETDYTGSSPKTSAPNEFEPYSDNAGTVVAIAGETFVILAADTRLSEQYMIRSRNWSRLSELAAGVAIGAAGCAADYVGLKHDLITKLKDLSFQGNNVVSIKAISNIVSSKLYDRRELPYLAYTILAGLDEDGRGVVINYDVLGSFEELLVTSCGKGQSMIDPILDELKDRHLVGTNKGDNDLWHYNSLQGKFISNNKQYLNITKQQAIDAIYRCFLAAAEREISVGDGIEVFIIEKDAEKSCSSSDHFPVIIRKSKLKLPLH